MALREPTRVLRISVFHRSAGGSGSNSMFEDAANHPGAIIEALRWLGTMAEAHDCTSDALAAFTAGVEARHRCEQAIGLTPRAAITPTPAKPTAEVAAPVEQPFRESNKTGALRVHEQGAGE